MRSSPARVLIPLNDTRPLRRVAGGWLPAMLVFLVLFMTWDDGSTSLFLGAIVPLHVLAFDHVLRILPSSCFTAVVTFSRLSMLLPVALAALV